MAVGNAGPSAPEKRKKKRGPGTRPALCPWCDRPIDDRLPGIQCNECGFRAP